VQNMISSARYKNAVTQASRNLSKLKKSKQCGSVGECQKEESIYILCINFEHLYYLF